MGKISVEVIEHEERWEIEPSYGDPMDQDWNEFQERLADECSE